MKLHAIRFCKVQVDSTSNEYQNFKKLKRTYLISFLIDVSFIKFLRKPKLSSTRSNVLVYEMKIQEGGGPFNAVILEITVRGQSIQTAVPNDSTPYDERRIYRIASLSSTLIRKSFRNQRNPTGRFTDVYVQYYYCCSIGVGTL